MKFKNLKRLFCFMRAGVRADAGRLGFKCCVSSLLKGFLQSLRRLLPSLILRFCL